MDSSRDKLSFSVIPLPVLSGVSTAKSLLHARLVGYVPVRPKKQFAIPPNRTKGLIALAVALSMMLTSCSHKVLNSLQDAVDETHNRQYGHERTPEPGQIVEQAIHGDIAFVTTAGAGVKGGGEFVLVSTKGGREWTVLTFVLFRVNAEGQPDSLLYASIGSGLAREKVKRMNAARLAAARKNWEERQATAEVPAGTVSNKAPPSNESVERKPTDQAGGNTVPPSRESAVRELTDQTLLGKMAREDEDMNVRRAAAERLTDQTVLAKIAREDKTDVGYIAVSGITNQTLLAEIATQHEDSFSRVAAVHQLTDQSVLAQIVVEDKHPGIRSVAAAKLTDESVLARIAINHQDAEVRLVAAGKIADPALLEKMAREDRSPEVRCCAIERITDQSVLAKCAREDDAYLARCSAIGKLTDQFLLSKISMEDNNPMARGCAVRRLTDRALLTRISENDKDWGVRQEALSALRNSMSR